MTLLSREVLELKDVTREFSDKEVAPIAQKLHMSGEPMPLSLIQKMRDMGYFGVVASPDYGGLGLGATAVAVITEELSRGWFAVGALPARNWVGGLSLEKSGTKWQKDRWLAKVVSGEIQLAHSGTEPEAGSDAANIKTTAVLKDGVYTVNGSKMWCTNADRADIVGTFVRTGRDDKHGGISNLWIEKTPGEAFVPPSFTGSRIKTIGYHGMNTYSLFFDNHPVPQEHLLGGAEGQAFKGLMAAYELARMQFAFRCIGLAQAAYDAAAAHAQQRVQFGQTIGKFQAVRFKLADMATQIEAARQLGYMVAQKLEAGQRVDLEAGMVKLYASEMAERVCNEAVQIHGGMGFAVESPVNRYWCDSRLCTIGEGTSEIQREVIARRLLGER